MFPEELGIKFKDYVRSIRNDSYESGGKKEIIAGMNKCLEKAVSARMEGNEQIGIAFSGGLDSTLIALMASKLNKNFMLLAVGFENSQDIEYAGKIGDYYGWPLKLKIISMKDAERIVRDVVKILNTDDVIMIGVGCVVYSVLELAKENGINVVLGGLGAEEIFAGYERHRKKHIEDPEKVHVECWDGLENLYAHDLERDGRIAEYFKARLLAPFLDDMMINFAMKIDPKLKVSKTNKKIILQDLALSMHLGSEFSLRKKKAAQYGSYFHQAIGKLAKKQGFKYIREYLHSLLSAR